MNIREFKDIDLPQIRRIVQSLHPKWFDDQAVKNIPFDIYFQKTFVAEMDGKAVGFICIRSQDRNPYIGWMGVDINHHRSGIGKALLTHAQKYIVAKGAKFLRVRTVVEQQPNDGSYDLTVQFYISNGFEVEKMEEEQTFEKYKYRMGTMVKRINS